MIAIIDYGLGNLTSVKNAFNKLGTPVVVTDNQEIIKRAKALVLPGVGAAGVGMKNLKAKGLDKLILEQINLGKPFLGICLGMQLLFDFSEEDATTCLGVIPGKVKKFNNKLKVPEVGWNNVRGNSPLQSNKKLLKDIPDNSYFYFVNSYYCLPKNKEVITGITEYGIEFCSALEKDNIFATQFHSEKSGDIGLKLLKNFTEVCI